MDVTTRCSNSTPVEASSDNLGQAERCALRMGVARLDWSRIAAPTGGPTIRRGTRSADVERGSGTVRGTRVARLRADMAAVLHHDDCSTTLGSPRIRPADRHEDLDHRCGPQNQGNDEARHDHRESTGGEIPARRTGSGRGDRTTTTASARRCRSGHHLHTARSRACHLAGTLTVGWACEGSGCCRANRAHSHPPSEGQFRPLTRQTPTEATRRCAHSHIDAHQARLPGQVVGTGVGRLARPGQRPAGVRACRGTRCRTHGTRRSAHRARCSVHPSGCDATRGAHDGLLTESVEFVGRDERLTPTERSNVCSSS